MHAALATLLCLLAAGCAAPAGDEGDDGDPPVTGGRECREGSGDLFVRAQHHPGFSPPEYQFVLFTLDREGTLRLVRAHHDEGEGSGRVTAPEGALHEIGLADVREVLEALGVYTTDLDFVVTLAWEDDVDPDSFDGFCDVVLEDFYDLDARYEDPFVADCDGFTFWIDTPRGAHSSYSYCQKGPQTVRQAWEDVVAESEDDLGVPGRFEQV